MYLFLNKTTGRHIIKLLQIKTKMKKHKGRERKDMLSFMEETSKGRRGWALGGVTRGSLGGLAASVQEGKKGRLGTDPVRLILVLGRLDSSEQIPFFFFFLKSKKGFFFC